MKTIKLYRIDEQKGVNTTPLAFEVSSNHYLVKIIRNSDKGYVKVLVDKTNILPEGHYSLSANTKILSKEEHKEHFNSWLEANYKRYSVKYSEGLIGEDTKVADLDRLHNTILYMYDKIEKGNGIINYHLTLVTRFNGSKLDDIKKKKCSIRNNFVCDQLIEDEDGNSRYASELAERSIFDSDTSIESKTNEELLYESLLDYIKPKVSQKYFTLFKMYISDSQYNSYVKLSKYTGVSRGTIKTCIRSIKEIISNEYDCILKLYNERRIKDIDDYTLNDLLCALD